MDISRDISDKPIHIDPNDNVRQILIWRSDLRNINGNKCRTGKIVSQLAHASLRGILNYNGNYPTVVKLWLDGLYTKICLQVDSLDELVEIYDQANKRGVNHVLIRDIGLTEFGNENTITCISLGPDYKSKLDFTNHLKLL